MIHRANRRFWEPSGSPGPQQGLEFVVVPEESDIQAIRPILENEPQVEIAPALEDVAA